MRVPAASYPDIEHRSDRYPTRYCHRAVCRCPAHRRTSAPTNRPGLVMPALSLNGPRGDDLSISCRMDGGSVLISASWASQSWAVSRISRAPSSTSLFTVWPLMSIAPSEQEEHEAEEDVPEHDGHYETYCHRNQERHLRGHPDLLPSHAPEGIQVP